MLVVAIGTMALIIVLSVFNGLEGLLRSLYGSVDPNIIVQPTVGKSFDYDSVTSDSIKSIPGIISITEVLEHNALLRYDQAQRVAKVKGVSENFVKEKRLDDFMVYGDMKLTEKNIPYAIVGQGVRYDLSINPRSDFYTIQMYYPDNIRPGMTNPESMYRFKNILPGGVFAVERTYDENLVFVPIRFAEELFNKKDKRSALELQIDPNFRRDEVKEKLKNLLGPDFKILTNEEVHSDLYRVLGYEKFFVFLTFSIIIAIASINIFFSLSMLTIDKKKDIVILQALGASRRLIRNIFLFEGAIVGFTGAFTGLALGLTISYLQQTFGFVTMGMETAIIDAYPVKLEFLDVVYSVLVIVLITLITAIKPAINASKTSNIKGLY